MEARIGKLQKHKVGDVGTGDAQGAGGKRVGEDAIGTSEGSIEEPGRPHNGVIYVAGRKQALLRGLVNKGVSEHGPLRNPEGHGGESILILAVVGPNPRGAQHDDPGHVLPIHGLENVGYGLGKQVRLFQVAGPQRREHSAVAADGVHHGGGIEEISLNNVNLRVRRQPIGIADERSDRVALSHRLRKNQLAGPPCGAEDDNLHLNPVCPSNWLQPPHYTRSRTSCGAREPCPYRYDTTLLQGRHLKEQRVSLMSENLEKTEKTLRDLIETLRDGHQGFIELEKNLKDPEARKLFREETLARAGFAGELENELHHFGVKDVKATSSTAGKVHRAWGELKARLGGGDHALLAAAEKGEDEAKRAYEEALASEDWPLPLREILLRQQRHILAAHDRVKALRDRLAA